MVGRAISEPLAGINAPLKLKMPVPDTAERWVERARELNYNVKIAQLGYQVADLERTRMAQQRLPQISIVASRKWNTSNYREINDERTATNTIGLELSMPIFDGGLIGGPVEVGNPGLWRGRAEDFFAAERPAVGAERDDSVGQLDMADRDLPETADGDAQRRQGCGVWRGAKWA